MSALVDGEMDAKGAVFLVRRIAADPDLNRRWQRLHLLRACLQREFSGPVSLVDRVQAAIADDEAPGVRRRPAASLLRVGFGGAIAASVALVAVVGLGNRLGSEGVGDAAVDESPGFVSQTTALDRQFNPRAVPAGFGANRSPSAEPAASRPSQQRINRYMIRHGQVAGGNGFISFTPVLTAPSSVQVVRPTPEASGAGNQTGGE